MYCEERDLLCRVPRGSYRRCLLELTDHPVQVFLSLVGPRGSGHAKGNGQIRVHRKERGDLTALSYFQAPI